MNDQNLIPVTKRTPREQIEISKKGGRASAKKKKEQKTMREMMRMLLGLPVGDSNKAKLMTLGVANEEDQTNKCMVAVGLMRKAMTGDPRAVEVLCGIAGDIFTIDKNEQEESEIEQTIKRLGSLEVKFVDASKGEKDENN